MRCQACGTMNEPGFRFCGSCGSRQQDSVVPAASQGAGGGGANGGGANFGPSIGPGQEQGGAPAGLGTDGAGAPALVAPRPRRSSGMSSASSLVVPGRSRVPLAALLVVDLGLAIGGGLLLRAGLAKPAVAAAGEPSPSSSMSGAAPNAGAPSAAGAPGASAASSAGAPAPAPSSAAPPTPPSPSSVPASNAPGGERESGDRKLATAAPKETPPATSAKREAPPAKRAKGSPASSAKEETINPYTPPDPPSSTKSSDAIRKQINAAIKKNQRAFDDCYTSIVKRPGAATLSVSYRVTLDGRLSDVRPMSLPPDGELLMSCVRSITSKWKVNAGNPDELMASTITFGKGR